jgi:hypothetical protein
MCTTEGHLSKTDSRTIKRPFSLPFAARFPSLPTSLQLTSTFSITHCNILKSSLHHSTNMRTHIPWISGDPQFQDPPEVVWKVLAFWVLIGAYASLWIVLFYPKVIDWVESLLPGSMHGMGFLYKFVVIWGGITLAIPYLTALSGAVLGIITGAFYLVGRALYVVLRSACRHPGLVLIDTAVVALCLVLIAKRRQESNRALKANETTPLLGVFSEKTGRSAPQFSIV